MDAATILAVDVPDLVDPLNDARHRAAAPVRPTKRATLWAILLGIACPPMDAAAQTRENQLPDACEPDSAFAAAAACAAGTRRSFGALSMSTAAGATADEMLAQGADPDATVRETAPSGTVSSGSPERAVREAQVLLNALGFDLGVADGVAGRRTLEALDAFYRRSGLPRRTVFDQATLDDLLEESLRYVEARRALERAREALSRGERSPALAALGEAERASSLLPVPPDLRREIERLPSGIGGRDATAQEPVERRAEDDDEGSRRARALVDELVWDAVRISENGDPETALRLLEEAERVADRPADTDELLARLRETIGEAASGERRSTELDELLERAEALVEAGGSARGARFDAYLDELSLAVDSLFEAPASD